MSFKRRWLVDGLVFLAIVVAIQLWQRRDAVAGPAPAIAGQLADGRAVTLDTWRAGHPGRPLLIHFWAEWCPICKAVEGSVDSVGRDWPLLTIAMQSGEARAVAAHLAARGLAWPAVVDAGGQITAGYGLHGVPAFVIVDAAGQIRFVEVGYTSELGLRARLWWAERFTT